ncbi:hypothetical protein JYU34_000835 [Plutella xylostella]|uniref:Retrotransposon gag domain-containing protein n=1 Tax=Plutella xylostella TaxID=51655 RepID=A0ABQ7R8N6_PLUXY|nr:uncharacterized protein LOC119694664 [Plutella xylostella]XP_037977383.2 uncharacterized protein LOC119694664 [Plutella xylostella]KAG7313675.1 hypothetical protein JYU34_000835 [Plutella xylostella]
MNEFCQQSAVVRTSDETWSSMSLSETSCYHTADMEENKDEQVEPTEDSHRSRSPITVTVPRTLRLSGSRSTRTRRLSSPPPAPRAATPAPRAAPPAPSPAGSPPLRRYRLGSPARAGPSAATDAPSSKHYGLSKPSSPARRHRYPPSTVSLSSHDLSFDSSSLFSKDRRSSRATSPEEKRRRMMSISEEHRDFVEYIMQKHNNKTNSIEGAHSMIPEFDPDAPGQSAEQWLRAVADTARTAGWSDSQIVFYALPKLAGNAKTWYLGRSSEELSWKQWQKKILRTFSEDRNYADLLSEMLSRKSTAEESLEDYFHAKARLVKACGLSRRRAVDCIVSGIADADVRFNAQCSRFKKPFHLLKYIRRISKRKPVLPKQDIPKKSTEKNKKQRETRSY